MPAQPPARRSELPVGQRGRESPLRPAQCDRWLLAIPELVSMRTSFFFCKSVEQFWIHPHVEREKF